MGAIAAASRAVSTLQRNPVIFVAGLFFALLSLPSYVFQAQSVPILSTAWAGVSFFISPFLVGGILGMADEGLTGRTSLSTFVSAGKSNYLNLLLVAILIMVVVLLVAGIGGAVIAVVGIFVLGFSAAGGVNAGAGALVFMAVLVLLFLLVLIAITLALMFAYQAVVVDDLGPIGAIKQSYRTVRSNLIGTVGVGIIAFLLGAVLSGGPVMLATMAIQSGPTAIDVPLSTSTAYLVIFGWGTLTTIVVTAFNNTMLVAFYDAVAPSP